MNITGNFQDSLALQGNSSSINSNNETFFNFALYSDQKYISNTSEYPNFYGVKWENHLFFSGRNVYQLLDLNLISNGSCNIYLIPEGSITANQSIYINKFNNVTFIALDNIFTNYPNTILITFEENSTNLMLQYTFGSNTDVFTSPNAYIVAYTINCTTWADNI